MLQHISKDKVLATLPYRNHWITKTLIGKPLDQLPEIEKLAVILTESILSK